MAYQLQLQLLRAAALTRTPDAGPHAAARVAIPHWYAHPPITNADFEAATRERDAALIAWQTAKDAFELRDPPPPLSWATYRQANAHRKRREEAIARETRRLDVSRERVRRMICICAIGAATRASLERGDVYRDRSYPELESLHVPAKQD